MASLHEILSTKVTTGVVSREAAATSRLLSFFGFAPGPGSAAASRNTRRVGTRMFGYDVFNDTRTVAYGRAPGNPAATVKRQQVGRVEGTFPRAYEKMYLPAEELHQFRRIGGDPSDQDSVGADYVTRQQRFMGQRLANFRMLLVAGMIQGGKLYGHKNGDTMIWNMTSASANVTIDWRYPAGNLSQLDMLGAGNIIDASWATASTDIPLHLSKIDTAFQELYGGRLDWAICTENTWQNVVNNTKVKDQAGSVNQPFTVFEREVGTGANGLPMTVKVGRIACRPFMNWLITNEGLKLGEDPEAATYTQFIEEDHVWFGPEPTPALMEMLIGSEPVSEGYGRPIQEQFGLHAWTKTTDDPAGYNLFGLDNALPALYNPNAVAYADTTP